MSSLTLEEILKNRGINKEDLVSEKKEDLDWKELDDVVDRTVDMLLEVSRVGVLYDVDADGLVSGKIVEEYLKEKGLIVYRFMNKRKKHGITEDVIDWVKRENVQLLYVVDAGTNDIEMHEKLSGMGIKVIVLDHHEQSRKKKVGLVDVVNCSAREDLPELSGAGVCYRYVEKLQKVLDSMGDRNEVDVEKYEPWVGLTVLSDHCNMLDKENRYYVDKLYKEYRNIDFFRVFRNWGSTRNLFTFGVIPFLNACIRTNHVDWAMDAVLLSGESRARKFVKDRRSIVIDFQRKKVEGIMDRALKKTGKEVILLRMADEDLEYAGLSGLIASKIKGKYNQPVCVIYKDGETFKGSFRGTSGVQDNELRELGWRVFGHAKAAGVEVDVSDMGDVLKRTLDLEVGEKEEVYDFKMTVGDVLGNQEQLLRLARFNEKVGGDLEPIYIKLLIGDDVWERNGYFYKINRVEKKVEYKFGRDYEETFEVRDFNVGRGKAGEWVVEPLLDSEGVVLLRK